MGPLALLASVSVDPNAIPGWFVGLILLAVFGSLGLLGTLIVGIVRRELSKLDKIPEVLADHDRRIVRLEARDDLGKEIADALRRNAA